MYVCECVDRLMCIYFLHVHAYSIYQYFYACTCMHTGLHICVCMQVWYVLFLAQCLKNSSEDKQSQKERRQQLFFQLMEQHEILPHLPHQPVPHREMWGSEVEGWW